MEKGIRIGVFVCHCGSNIAAVVNISDLTKYIRSLKYVVLVDEGKWSCSADYLEKLSNLIKEYRINRIVIASCSPRTHEPLFKQAVKKAGLNPYLLEFVSIREQVSWVHMKEPLKATQKAKDLVSMGVAKAFLLEKGHEIKISVGRNCLIIGGGVAGISAALSLANQGFSVFLIEKERELGGLIKGISLLCNDNKKISSKKILHFLLGKVSNNENIKVFNESKIEFLEGYVGNYKVKLKKRDSSSIQIDIDTIVVATGMQEMCLDKIYHCEKTEVLSQLDLEKLLIDNQISSVKKTVMINCINSKNKERGCCSIGCHISLKNAIELKKLDNRNDIVIMYRDLSIHKCSGDMFYEAKKKGIIFIRFSSDKSPKVLNREGKTVVKVYDHLSNRSLEFVADLIVLTIAFVGSESVDQLKSFLKVSSNKDNFFQESHVKLNPLEFPSEGIGLCGCAKFPMFFEESMNEGIGAAMRVSIAMNKGYIDAEGIVASVNIKICNKCCLCSKNCPYNAILINDDGYPEIIKALCRGCGLCAADCISNAITILHYSDSQIFAQIEAGLNEEPYRKIIGFVCHWCALGGVDMAGVGRLQYKSNILLIRVMCSARVSFNMLEKSLELGAAGVLVVGCEFPTCHYINGNYAAKKRITKAKRKLTKLGYTSDKLWVDWCSAADGPKFASIVNNMVKALEIK